MSAPKFTPGPWYVGGTFLLPDHGETQNVWTDPLPGDQSGICVCQYAKPGDARLIAAAPELYEALRGLMDGCEYRTYDGIAGWHRICMPKTPALDNARAALAKAAQ